MNAAVIIKSIIYSNFSEAVDLIRLRAGTRIFRFLNCYFAFHIRMNTAKIIKSMGYNLFPGSPGCDRARGPFLSRIFSNIMGYYILVDPLHGVTFGDIK